MKKIVLMKNRPFTMFSTEADIDYLLSRWIGFSGVAFQSRAGFFAQQACEKYMKSIMVQEDEQYIETHKLIDLSNHCSKYSLFFEEKKLIGR